MRRRAWGRIVAVAAIAVALADIFVSVPLPALAWIGEPTGWRTRVRLAIGADGRPGFHRYHSDELVTDLRCAQLPAGMLDDLPIDGARVGDQLHVVLDDDGARHVVASGGERRPRVLAGEYAAVQRVGDRRWTLPVTAFWQSHRDAAGVYSELVTDWAAIEPGATTWDLYGGAGLFAAALAERAGPAGQVVSVDTSRSGARAGRAAHSMPMSELAARARSCSITATRNASMGPMGFTSPLGGAMRPDQPSPGRPAAA